MPTLFDPTMTPTEAVKLLTAEALALADGQWTTDSARLGKAIESILDDHLRLTRVADTALAVRLAQRAYFRDRNNLTECKALERTLDKLLAERTG